MSITCYFDGSSKGNPGICTANYVVEGLECGDLYYNEKIGSGANNFAEWTALKMLIHKLLELNVRNCNIRIIGDSQLVVYGIIGKYKVKHKGLAEIAAECNEKLLKLRYDKQNNIEIVWKERQFNKADKQSYEGNVFRADWNK